MSSDEAETALSANPCPVFNEDELGQLEEDVRDLNHLIISLTPHDLLASTKFKSLLVKCTKQWPRLRATARVGSDGHEDVSLIPRAMQTEEDLEWGTVEYKSLIAAHKFAENG